jgi:hypothetical protein
MTIESWFQTIFDTFPDLILLLVLLFGTVFTSRLIQKIFEAFKADFETKKSPTLDIDLTPFWNILELSINGKKKKRKHHAEFNHDKSNWFFMPSDDDEVVYMDFDKPKRNPPNIGEKE